MMMKKNILSCLSFLLFFSFSCKKNAEKPLDPPKSIKIKHDIFEEVELENIYAQFKKDKFHIVEFNFDPIMGKPNKYSGILLTDLLEYVYGKAILDSLKPSYSLELICKDGYAPQMKLEQIWQQEGYVVDRIVGEPNKWPSDIFDKYQPFYLVWKNQKTTNKAQWPYGLVSIRLINVEKEKECLLPVPDKTAQNGLRLFKKYCIKCHAINGFGGSMGPEMNYPKNILTYWKEEILYEYIKQPQSFRYNSAMKPVKNITEKEINHIIDYFKYIENHSKLCE